jgi:hypothetical protein
MPQKNYGFLKNNREIIFIPTLFLCITTINPFDIIIYTFIALLSNYYIYEMTERKMWEY